MTDPTTTTIDWAAAYQQAALPILRRFRTTPPAILGIIAALVASGVLMIVAGGAAWGAAGVVPIGAGAFMAWMIQRGRQQAASGGGVVFLATVQGKAEEEAIRRDVNETLRSRTLYVLHVEVTQQGRLVAEGLRDMAPAGPSRRRLTTSAEVHAGLREGEAVYLVQLMGVDGHAHFAVRPGGDVLHPG